ncbi:MAG: hypothetical protein KJ583_05030 [Nanoarchaeota archaeon]|nr:hypothetical protein [Nanoarchaeota archaeon]MBU1270338.1 hypothetical protein [Nanoarchaeota archaeon]MBU1604653.1 hypothetical protein [Nanoarchaeota archaeon]MBU2443130.1 hypothetical protein [Nanoarchaeota archaeon]
MSFFHKTLIDVLNETDHKKACEIIKNHLDAIEKEVELGEIEIAELKLYRQHLLKAVSVLSSLNSTHKKPEKWKPEIENHIRNAHALILDIELKIKQAYKNGHKFLE